MKVVYIKCVIGYSKLDPAIFLLAIESVGVRPQEAIHVGDTCDSDVVESRLADLTPVLLDRNDLYGEVDCLKITGLGDLVELIRRGI